MRQKKSPEYFALGAFYQSLLYPSTKYDPNCGSCKSGMRSRLPSQKICAAEHKCLRHSDPMLSQLSDWIDGV